MMGVSRGRLAGTMDIVTDAMTLVGQHGVYCQSGGVMTSLTGAKELIQSVMEELKNGAAGGDERQPDAFQ